MKSLLIAVLFVLTSAQSCHQKIASVLPANCYKGRLEIKGICANYTIKLLEGDLDSKLIEQSWTDENTKKIYSNVFALGSPCTFPAEVEQGAEFYFTIDNSKQDCMVCQAYYPKPGKALSIKVVSSCN